MKVLVACEESQTVTKAFRRLGHEAYSCDVQECSGGHPEWHLCTDVLQVLDDDWDLIIAHPPCTYLANSGVQHLYNKDGTRDNERWANLTDAIEFFNVFRNAKCKHIAIENPIPHKYGVGKTYSQIIQPWMFGHTETKATCLWLKGLPELYPTNNVKEEMLLLPKKVSQRLHYLSPGRERAKLRSKTYDGIAKAMASQWSNYVLEELKC